MLRPALVLILLSCSALAAQRERRVLAMGTELSIHVEGHVEAASALDAASEAAVREVARIETACSTWHPDSLWSRLNRSGGHWVTVGSEWAQLLRASLVWQERTQGTFDPVLAALMRTWGIRRGGRVPSVDEVNRARAHSGARLLEVDAARGRARLRLPGAGVEEGGFVKGYALDRSRRVLEAAGVARGWLDFGGQILAWNDGLPDGLEVELAHPRDRHRPLLRLTLVNASLSTSGTSERGRHILDPRTGQLAPDWGSVSALASDALSADVLSLALLVMGPDQGLRWANQQHVAALFITNDGRVTASQTFPPFERFEASGGDSQPAPWVRKEQP